MRGKRERKRMRGEREGIHAYNLNEYLYRDDDDRGLMSRVCSFLSSSFALSLSSKFSHFYSCFNFGFFPSTHKVGNKKRGGKPNRRIKVEKQNCSVSHPGKQELNARTERNWREEWEKNDDHFTKVFLFFYLFLSSSTSCFSLLLLLVSHFNSPPQL